MRSSVASSSARQELVQRRVEQPDRDRQARHRLEDALEVGLLHRQQPVERAAPALPRRRPGSSPARPAAARRRRTCARCGRGRSPRAPNSRARAASSGVSAFARTFSRRRSSAQPSIVSKSSLICGGTSGTAPTITRPVPPSIVISVALAQLVLADARDARLQVERERLAAGHARLAHPARDDRRVRGHAAVGGEDPLRRDHPVDVVGRRLPADEDHRPRRFAALDRGVGVEDDLAARRARARVEARRGDVVAARSGRASGAAAGRAAPGRSARPPPRARSAPRRPCRPRPSAPPRRCASPRASAAGRAARPRP